MRVQITNAMRVQKTTPRALTRGAVVVAGDPGRAMPAVRRPHASSPGAGSQSGSEAGHGGPAGGTITQVSGVRP
jgi:hypothetical protein